MRILVCGSRHFDDWDTLDGVLSAELHDTDTLIHGCAKGADVMAANWFEACTQGKGTIEEYPADWEKHGKAAGPIRNKQMLDEGKPDQVIAFMAKDSRGTKNMIEQAEKAGIPVKVINI
jgi:YspA, cpYpsA-related SLOG family